MPFRTLSTPRRSLVVVAILFGVLEAVDAFRVEETAFALVFAALTLVVAWWTTRGGASGPITLALLGAMELAGILFFYPRPDSTLVWVDYGTFAALSVALIALAAWTLVAERRGG